MELAIPKIDRRLQDLSSLDVGSIISQNDPRISVLDDKLTTLLIDVFGANTIEHTRYHLKIGALYRGPLNMYEETPIHEVRDAISGAISEASAILESIKEGFEETLSDAGRGSAGSALRAYQGMELHPAIERAVGNLFRDGHYANAIEDAVKSLNALVRLNSGIEDKDGSALMEAVFNPKSPILSFNTLQDEADKNEQRGFMMMFSGAVAGLRNPRAHKLIKDDSERALEFVAFVSLLAKLADASQKVK